ncbi:histidine kinase [Rhodoferax lacus]|uniref:Histidine kinase n=1 Tax=Rhodoferax lacus TaxID=2184758 RepID=A0A3E1RHH9_9BURK|nr:histidine kinase [Rhodoferax lacus]
MPSISRITHALIQMIDGQVVGLNEVCALIAQDPAISARLLKLANSSQFGLPRAVGRLPDAVTMVGLERVRTLAVGAILSDTFNDFPRLDHNAFWRSAMDCAGYAEWLAPRVGIQGHIAWITGLMLHLGQLLISQAEPEVLAAIERLPRIAGVQWRREQRLIGFTEGQITAELARRWKFPPQMVQALQRSADPMAEDGFSRLGAVVHLAALLAEAKDAGPHTVAALPLDVLAALSLDTQWMFNTFPNREKFVNLG